MRVFDTLGERDECAFALDFGQKELAIEPRSHLSPVAEADCRGICNSCIERPRTVQGQIADAFVWMANHFKAQNQQRQYDEALQGAFREHVLDSAADYDVDPQHPVAGHRVRQCDTRKADHDGRNLVGRLHQAKGERAADDEEQGLEQREQEEYAQSSSKSETCPAYSSATIRAGQLTIVTDKQ